MNPWLISALCAGGAGIIAWGAARLRMRWPLLVLSLLLAAIAGQLYLAARGQGGFHDLAAMTAQMHTVLPALAGVVAGLALAAMRRHPPPWRGRAGVFSAAGLLAAAALAGATLLI